MYLQMTLPSCPDEVPFICVPFDDSICKIRNVAARFWNAIHQSVAPKVSPCLSHHSSSLFICLISSVASLRVILPLFRMVAVCRVTCAVLARCNAREHNSSSTRTHITQLHQIVALGGKNSDSVIVKEADRLVCVCVCRVVTGTFTG